MSLPATAAQQTNGTQLVDNNITVNTQLVDSVLTSGLAKTPLSYFKDPIFGTTEANVAAALNLPSGAAYGLPNGSLTTDSAVLVLRYNDGFYGDSLNSNYKINVYQLDEQLTSGTAYYNNKSWKTLTPLLGSRSFKAYTHTTFKITDIVTGKPDTLKKVLPQLRVPVSTAFINRILFNATSNQLSYPAIFQAAVKGLYLTLDQNQTGNGGNIMLNLDSSHVDVYYKTVNGSIIDTAMVSLPFVSALHAAQIKHNFSSTVLNAVNSTASNNLVYLQGLGGTRAKVAFPNLTTLFGTSDLTKVVLNRAELVITPATGSTIPFVAAPKLSVYRYNISKQVIQLPDATTGNPYFQSVGIFDGYFSQTLLSYHFIVTGYLQGLLHGTFPDYGTYIVPVDTTNKSSVDISPTAQMAGRSIIVGSDKTSGYNIKLNVIYSKTNQ